MLLYGYQIIHISAPQAQKGNHEYQQKNFVHFAKYNAVSARHVH